VRAGQVWYLTIKDGRLKRNADFKGFAGLTCENAMKAYGAEVRDVVYEEWKVVGVYAVSARFL
jgi:hypothetical protein